MPDVRVHLAVFVAVTAPRHAASRARLDEARSVVHGRFGRDGAAAREGKHAEGEGHRED